MSKVKFAVLGCGRIGQKHIKYINLNPKAHLVAVSDTKINDIDIEYKIENKFTNVDELLSSHIDVDIINIATPNGSHAEHAIKCLESLKHVIIEKPMALSKIDAEKIIKTSINKNKKVFVVMQNRYSPNINFLKKLIDENKLGKIFFINANCFWNRNENYYNNHEWHGNKNNDGGVLYTQFSHFIDAIYWLFGDFNKINTNLQKFTNYDKLDFEDTGTINFELSNGGIGIINFTIATFKKHFESSITILGEKGSIKIEGQYLEKITNCTIDNFKDNFFDNRIIPEFYKELDNNEINHALVIENAINVLQENFEIKTNALDGLKVTEIIENIYEKNNK